VLNGHIICLPSSLVSEDSIQIRHLLLCSFWFPYAPHFLIGGIHYVYQFISVSFLLHYFWFSILHKSFQRLLSEFHFWTSYLTSYWILTILFILFYSMSFLSFRPYLMAVSNKIHNISLNLRAEYSIHT
jgi:hypothetical protein